MVPTNEEFKKKVLDWTTEQNKCSRAIWEIHDLENYPDMVIIDVRQPIKYSDGGSPLSFELHCACTTKDEIGTIRSAVEAINEEMFFFLDKLF